MGTMKKRLKLKKEPFIKLIIGIIVFIIVLTLGINYYNKRYERKLKKIGYTSTEIKILKTNKTDLSIVSKYDYIPVIASIIENENYINDNLKQYLDIYQNNRDIEAIIYIVNNNIEHEYSDKLVSLIHSDYFILNRLDRYMKYDKSTDANIIVRDVNSNIDFDFYTNVTTTDTSKGKLMLVNKYYSLDDSYSVEDLVKVDNLYANLDGNMLNNEAYGALINMINAADNEGYNIRLNYSYRDYATQESVYNDYKKNRGQEYADAYAARPGHSEHQTGYAIDIGVQSRYATGSFKNSKEYTWMKDNSYKYGYILRYPEGMDNITGYSFEAWHYRYVGVDVATYIYEHNITFDEYYAYFIEKN